MRPLRWIRFRWLLHKGDGWWDAYFKVYPYKEKS